MGSLNETVMEAEPLLSPHMGPVRAPGDNRVGWIPNCEDAAPPGCAPVCKPTCCAFCAFCAFRYFNSARASRGLCSACYAFCACYLVSVCCAFSKPHVQHRWPQKRASGQKPTDGRQKNINWTYSKKAMVRDGLFSEGAFQILQSDLGQEPPLVLLR